MNWLNAKPKSAAWSIPTSSVSSSQGGIGSIIEANEAFLNVVGYDREDLTAGGVLLRELTAPEWVETSTRARKSVDRTGAAQPFEMEYLRKDGSRVPVLIGSVRLFDRQRDHAVTFVLDLTERKRAETEARESENRYQEIQLVLAHANRVDTMGQLTASIAHEVTQPISGISTTARAALRWLANEPPAVEKARSSLERIVRDVDRASNVIGRVRALVKKAPGRREHFSINDAIGEVISLTRSETQKHQIAVKTQFENGLPHVEADRVQLQQVLLNLIVNAIQAMAGDADGGRDLFITTARVESNGVLVAVADSGPGLDPSKLEYVFDPFYTTKPDGLGIGLSICRTIIDAHGGRLWLEPNRPRGAVFQFMLPVADQNTGIFSATRLANFRCGKGIGPTSSGNGPWLWSEWRGIVMNGVTIGRNGQAALAFAAVLLAAASAFVLVGSATPARAEVRDKWCKGVHIRFFVGGAEGNSFGTIVYNGAKQAERDLGPRVDYIFSGWDVEKMVQQLREAIAVKPDGIAMMGHPGDAAIMPLAEEAASAGIKMMYQNVPVPKVIAKFGGGYVGAQVAQLGRALGAEVVRRAGDPPGDVVFMQGPFENENRGARERSTVAAMEEAGIKVVKINSQAGWACRSEPCAAGNHRCPRQIPGSKGDWLWRRPNARQRARLYASSGQESGRGLQFRRGYKPSGRGRFQGRVGAARSRSAALHARLPADPRALPADLLPVHADQRGYRRRLRNS